MKKNLKLVSVLSASALLALGGSFTSFAASGWQQNDGSWVYYDKDGQKETNTWMKSGTNWFYLNSEGNVVTDSLIEFEDNFYYVNSSGAMVQNGWVSVDSKNDFYNGDTNEDDPSNFWYYFGSNGRAYKSDSQTTSFKTINGKKYAFDEDGKMLYGWVKDGERKTEDDGWKDAEYYLGDENDGCQSVGWVKLLVTDDDWDKDDDVFNEDQERWFYFKSNGKKVINEDDYSINKNKYGFDQYGRMLYEWVSATPNTATKGTATYSTAYKYFNSVENGARVTKGWFKVKADESLDSKAYDDDEEAWYYSDSNGDLVAGEVRTINGKKYAFDTYGKMLDGLKLVEISADGKNISTVYDDEDYDTEDLFDEFIENHPTAIAYYFGSEDDGVIKTGSQTINLDGESNKFYFKKSGTVKGQGIVGVDDNKIYNSGKLMKADKDEKYKVVEVTTENGVTTVKYVDTSNFVSNANHNESKKRTDYDVLSNDSNTTYYLVNTSGQIQKTKNKAKDGDDFCFATKNKVITEVYVED